MASTPPTMPLSRSECYATLFEMIGLVRLVRHHNPTSSACSVSRRQLESLIDRYLQEDEYGDAFRSMICYGCSVPLERFNQFIILPSSNYEFKLSPPTTGRIYQFQEVDKDTQRVWLVLGKDVL